MRNQVSLSALKALIIHMGSLKEGRKSLILVSEGYTYMVPPQMRNADAQQPGLGNPNAFNPFAGQNDPNEDRAAWLSGLDMDSDLREIYDTANQQQRRDLRRRSARAARVRVRHQRRRRHVRPTRST